MIEFEGNEVTIITIEENAIAKIVILVIEV